MPYALSDPDHRPGDTKSRNRRDVPISGRLREYLAAARLAQPPGAEFCFDAGDGRPFRPDRLQERADVAWAAGGLERLTLHDCRNTMASLAIVGGVNAKALSTYLGHSTVAITLDRYGTSCRATGSRRPACSPPTSAPAPADSSRRLSRTSWQPRSA